MKDNKDYLFRIKRPVLWFFTEQVVSVFELKKWYTNEAIKQLYNSGYLEIISEIIPKKES